MRIIIIAAALLALAGCASTTPGVGGIRLDPPAASSLKSCNLPTDLPIGEMTQRDIERYWGLDRKHQVECAKRHAALRDYIIDRDAGIVRK
jgi:hypothetical protein